MSTVRCCIILVILFCELALEYYCWYTTNIVSISVFNSLSMGSGLVVAVFLCVKRDDIIICLGISFGFLLYYRYWKAH